MVIAGAVDRTIDEPNQQRRTVVQSGFRVHEAYSPTTLLNDIAILRMPTPFTFNSFVGSIDLATGNDLFQGQIATASGFGRTSDTSAQTSPQVRRVDLIVMSNSECMNVFNFITESSICTATLGGRSPCNGDTGGPLFITNAGNRQQIGIFSFSSTTGCQANIPAGFTRVSSFATWIGQNIQ